jgi:hypothetical protein
VDGEGGVAVGREEWMVRVEWMVVVGGGSEGGVVVVVGVDGEGGARLQ